MSDARVPLDPILDAFGVSAVVTRPAPDNTPITTRAVWLKAAEIPQPFGTDFTRREPEHVLVVPRSAVPTMPRGTFIDTPEMDGSTVVRWVVDGLDETESDAWRANVTRHA